MIFPAGARMFTEVRFVRWECHSNVADRRFGSQMRLQARHEYPVVFTWLETLRMVFERPPLHDETEMRRRLDALQQPVPLVALRPGKQMSDLGKRAPECVDPIGFDGEGSNFVDHVIYPCAGGTTAIAIFPRSPLSRLSSRACARGISAKVYVAPTWGRSWPRSTRALSSSSLPRFCLVNTK